MGEVITDERRDRISRLVSRLTGGPVPHASEAQAKLGRDGGKAAFGLLALGALSLLIGLLAAIAGSVSMALIGGLMLVGSAMYGCRLHGEDRLIVVLLCALLPVPATLLGVLPRGDLESVFTWLYMGDIWLAAVEVVALSAAVGLMRDPERRDARTTAAIVGALLVFRGLAPPVTVAPPDSGVWAAYPVGIIILSVGGALVMMAAIDRSPQHRGQLAMVGALCWIASLGPRLLALGARTQRGDILLSLGIPGAIGLCLLLFSYSARCAIDDEEVPA